MCAEDVGSKIESGDSSGDRPETSREKTGEEWERFDAELRNLRDRVFKRAQDKYGQQVGFWSWKEETIDPFIEKLEKKFSGFAGCKKYVAYQILNESSPRPDESPYLDFSESDYSVKEFLLKCERELEAGDKKE